MRFVFLLTRFPKEVCYGASVEAGAFQPVKGRPLALFLPFAGVPEPAIDSPWTLEVKHYTIVKIRAEIPLLSEPDEH